MSEETISENNSAASMEDLPNDLLLLVFGYLPFEDRLRLEVVCKRWLVLLKKSWANVEDVQLDSGVDHKKAAAIFQRCSSHVCSLDFTKFDGRWNGLESRQLILSEFFNFDYPKLKSLNLRNVRLSLELLQRISQLQGLESLNISMAVPEAAYGDVADAERIELAISEFLHPLTSLKKLSIGSVRAGGRFLRNLPMCLQKIIIFGSSGRAFDGEVNMQRLFQSGPREQLTEIHLTLARLPEGQGIDLFSAGAENLRVLDLSYTGGVNNLEALANFQRLEELYLNDIWYQQDNENYEMQQQFLGQVPHFQSAQSLRVLHLNNFALYSAFHLEVEKLSHFTEFRELSLEGNCPLNNEKLEIILSACKQLERILLSGCRMLDDHSLAVIGNNCAGLTLLDISWKPSPSLALSIGGLEMMVKGLVHNSLNRDSTRSLDIFTFRREEFEGIKMQQFSAYGNVNVLLKPCPYSYDMIDKFEW